MWWLLALMACEVVPRHVQETSEVDAFLVRGAYGSACVALDNEADDGLRTYAASELHKVADRVADQCLCAAVYRPERHRADFAVLKGLVDTQRDDLAVCAAAGLADTEVPDRDELARAIGNMDARKGYAALADVAANNPELDVRLAAIKAMKRASGERTALLALLDDDVPAIRAAAAVALTGRTHRTVEEAARRLLEDEAVEVRAAALGLLVGADPRGSQRAVCAMLMGDADATMRIGAARAFHGSEERGAIDCLERRLTTTEENPAVRDAVMDALKASPSDRAAKALCDVIGPMMKLYVKDRIAEETEGVAIVQRQNDRDWDNSFACVEKALKSGGLSCYARNHLGKWMNDLGGKASRPWCPGMERR
jgi:HEAT repeat protein